ncbi:hypothetical protein PAECIP111893_05327 [Paenibacillus plantiphilus]|uniref:Uncharacterized protein n=1 Tax=Paenibacillus plantiphilus TaxID=2905650 RepID=A0ABN8H3R2_9BACL|nr:hypothetical protein [Paenibacillus plantiphilus]CAH1226149.1 hypothetical protein PAECIP111893_05327 [Paenibacillus plantiphilus]
MSETRHLFRLALAMVFIGLLILWIQGERVHAASIKPEVLVEGMSLLSYNPYIQVGLIPALNSGTIVEGIGNMARTKR